MATITGTDIWFDEASPTTWTDDYTSTDYITGTATETAVTTKWSNTPAGPTVASATPTSYYYSFDYQSLTKGAIIGIAIGSALGGLVVGSLLIWFLVRKLLGRREREEVSKGRSSTSSVDDGAAGASKAQVVQRAEPVYEMDDSTMRREMGDTGTRGEMEGAQKQGTADRYRRYMGLR